MLAVILMTIIGTMPLVLISIRAINNTCLPSGVRKMILTCLLVSLVTFISPQANSWRGIVPLHSTRADVEKLLGRPTPESKAQDAAIYRTENERVFVLFSTGSCEIKPSNGWSVPTGTVISISVEPNSKPKFADIKLDESNYEKRPDPELLYLTYYTNERDGVSIEVNTDEGVVTAFRHGPASKDKRLRCSTTSDGSLEALRVFSHKLDEYSDMPLIRERKRLDRFAKQLLRYPTTEGYIIVYSGKGADRREAQRIAERAKRYLVDKRRIYAGRIKLTVGEYNEKWTVELWLVPVGAVPPAPKDRLDRAPK
jgi:hypothetical protein